MVSWTACTEAVPDRLNARWQPGTTAARCNNTGVKIRCRAEAGTGTGIGVHFAGPHLPWLLSSDQQNKGLLRCWHPKSASIGTPDTNTIASPTASTPWPAVASTRADSLTAAQIPVATTSRVSPPWLCLEGKYDQSALWSSGMRSIAGLSRVHAI